MDTAREDNVEGRGLGGPHDALASVLAAGVLRLKRLKGLHRAGARRASSLKTDLTSTPKRSVHGDRKQP